MTEQTTDEVVEALARHDRALVTALAETLDLTAGLREVFHRAPVRAGCPAAEAQRPLDSAALEPAYSRAWLRLLAVGRPG